MRKSEKKRPRLPDPSINQSYGPRIALETARQLFLTGEVSTCAADFLQAYQPHLVQLVQRNSLPDPIDPVNTLFTTSSPPPRLRRREAPGVLSQSLPQRVVVFAGAGALARREGRRGGEGERADEGEGDTRELATGLAMARATHVRSRQTCQNCSAQSSETSLVCASLLPVSSAYQHCSTRFLAEREPTTTTTATARATDQTPDRTPDPCGTALQDPPTQAAALHSIDTPTVAAQDRSALFA